MIPVLCVSDEMNGEADKENVVPEQPVTKKKLRLSYDEYKSISNLIVYYMRRQEAKQEGEPAYSFSCLCILPVMVGWYMSSCVIVV